MSTRSIVARTGKSEGTFEGVYVHWDGSPTTRVPILMDLLKSFRGNLAAMLQWLIAEHPRGWSTLQSRRRDCKAYTDGEPFIFTHETFARDDGSAEWVFAFDIEQKRLYIRDVLHKEDAGFVDLAAPIPTKEQLYKIECGKNFERCKHYAWVHGLAPKSSRLSTQTYLGRRPLDYDDAVAFIIDGKRYERGGTGFNANYATEYPSVFRGGPFPANSWISSVTRNRRQKNVPVAKITKDGYQPYPGVQWVMPPTKDNPAETIVGGVA
jgi:hypothetical protein